MRDTFHFHSSARPGFTPPTFRARLRTHLRRAFGRDPNPLCRPVDRLRSRLVLGALLIVTVAVALSWLPARLVQRHEERDAAWAARHHHLVEASVLAPSTASTDPQPFGNTSGFDTKVGWTYPAGHLRTTIATTPEALPTSERIPLWVDDSGALTIAPRSSGEMAMDAAWAGTTALLAETALVVVMLTAADRVLQRRSRRTWATEWANVEPGWSQRA